jgi:hypothetical protein
MFNFDFLDELPVAEACVDVCTLHASFVSYNWHADIRITSNNDPGMRIDIVHHSPSGDVWHTLYGQARTPMIAVLDGDEFRIAVGRNGIVIAHARYQVRTLMVEAVGAILLPKECRHLFLGQCDKSLADAAINAMEVSA